ncbi:hypothetical protein ONZ43_g897 [Nemania bipapillata]|uniref:Uncharacterized protein n=1 Tax=Nemania bipapillata TaxID=110536 RepID=A0ACC2J6K2_9PEZI|nr:hypothetical protein ONZ43_g897 [Nemania bipapillata]
MRFNLAAALLALPLLAASDTPDYQAQFQEFLGQAQGHFEKLASRLPSPNTYDPVAAAAAKDGPNNVHVIALHNWKETLYGPVTPGSITPEEWWVLMTGGNKTCFGHCGKVEAAFNETAGKFASEATSPHMALLNCDNQPVLCNAWSAPVGSLWIFEMLPEPSPISIFSKRLNLTTVTSDDLVQLEKGGYKAVAREHDGIFHPFNGPLAQNGLSIPAGYLLWACGLLPSWAFMILVSLFSRRMMASRMEGQMRGGPRPATTGQAAPRR